MEQNNQFITVDKKTMIKISYFRDWTSPDRVLCIARQFDKENGTVRFAYAINRPTEWIFIETPDFVGKHRVVGDAFSKAKARYISKARLVKRGTTIKVPEGMLPIRACLEWLENEENDTNPHVNHIARYAIREFDKSENEDVK